MPETIKLILFLLLINLMLIVDPIEKLAANSGVIYSYRFKKEVITYVFNRRIGVYKKPILDKDNKIDTLHLGQ